MPILHPIQSFEFQILLWSEFSWKHQWVWCRTQDSAAEQLDSVLWRVTMDSSSERANQLGVSCPLQWLSEAPPSGVILKDQKLSVPCDFTVFLPLLLSRLGWRQTVFKRSSFLIHLRFLVFRLIYILHTHTHTICMGGCPLMPEEVSSSGAGVTVGCELSCGYWELNSSPLQKQQVLLTSEPSFPFCWICFY